MEAPESRSSSVPNSDRFGEQPALCAGYVLLVSEDDSSTFLCELLPRSIDKFLAASTVVHNTYNRSSGHSQLSTVSEVAAKAKN